MLADKILGVDEIVILICIGDIVLDVPLHLQAGTNLNKDDYHEITG